MYVELAIAVWKVISEVGKGSQSRGPTGSDESERVNTEARREERGEQVL